MVWVGEKGNGYGIIFEAYEKLYESKGIQRIEIYDTKFGKMLVIDGCIQLVEKFEKAYHEMLVHVPMITHPDPKNVLIIGGGDGGTLREVLKYDVDRVVMVEIDKNVVESCRKYIGIDKGAFNDERVELRIEDGFEYIKKSEKAGEVFDVLIVDGTDPSPTSMPLFSAKFFSTCSEVSEVFCMQSQSPALQEKEFKFIVKNSSVFERRAFYVSCIPMYPGGIWSFLIAGKLNVRLSLEEVRRRFLERNIEVEHYTPQLHVSAFSLPKWMETLINSCI